MTTLRPGVGARLWLLWEPVIPVILVAALVAAFLGAVPALVLLAVVASLVSIKVARCRVVVNGELITIHNRLRSVELKRSHVVDFDASTVGGAMDVVELVFQMPDVGHGRVKVEASGSFRAETSNGWTDRLREVVR